ncbi:hypothetical protein OG883_42355 [Streptomyces sp. NBC_01142]|uniref:hypothetical protein n=1 Tax=Streptomyces sp. NBC_01142 TaxID=2975865 RepID=UPI00225A9958|nr:hypothetical protein [Streptomyces sp. NBC_01142]MCX4826290.1 hypothetical protein [Streptomyces sp. NBC_01142]
MSTALSRRTLVSVLATLMAATAISQVHAPAAHAHHSPPKQWSLQFSGGVAKTDEMLALYNQREKDYLYYAHRDSGINLKWSASVKREWKFVKCGAEGTSGPIRFDQSLALYNASIKRYVTYEKRSWGINLGWSKAPKCQWKVRGGAAGTRVGSSPVNSAMLFNSVVKDYLVNAWRPVGVNLRWYTYDFSTQAVDSAIKGTCAIGGLSNEAKIACGSLKALREIEKALGYSLTSQNSLSRV